MNLHEHINQDGVTTGPKKLAIFRKACELMAVPPIHGTTGSDEPVALVKIFDPCGSWTWYVQEFDPETNEAFGLVDGFEKEFGYFSLSEMSEVAGPLGIGLEVDVWFKPTPVKELNK